MTALLALALLSAIGDQDPPCPVIAPVDSDRLFAEEHPEPHQASGPGLWIGGIGFTAADLASAVAEDDPLTEEPRVVVNFTQSGHGKFREAQRCRPTPLMEISVDGRAVTRVMLMEEITGPSVAISGGFTHDGAAAIATRLEAIRNGG